MIEALTLTPFRMVLTELEAIDAVKSGRRERFADLYDLYVDKIYAFVYARVSHRETAEDLTSVVFMKALQHVDRFTPGSVQAWLYRIARTTVIDHYRTRKQADGLDEADRLAGADDLAADAERRSLLAQVHEQLRTLTPDQQDIVRLRVWDDLPYADIAAIMGKSEGAVKMAFSQAVATMSANLAPLSLLTLFLLS